MVFKITLSKVWVREAIHKKVTNMQIAPNLDMLHEIKQMLKLEKEAIMTVGVQY